MVTVKEITDEKIWDDFTAGFDGSNFLQSFSWGEFHKSLGKKIFRDVFFRDGKLAGVMLSIKETAKRASYLTVPGGPLVDFTDRKLVEKTVTRMRIIASESNCSFVRVRPQLPNSPENIKLFNKLGFKKAPFHLHVELTIKIDLFKSDEELMAEMRKATRYELRQAMKTGITVSESVNPEDMDDFYKLQLVTAKRQEFIPFSLRFLKNQFAEFAKRDQVRLYTAKLEGKILAQAMIIFYGQEADYHYGASTEEGRKYPGAYLLMWKAIQEAKKRGLKYYDLWGIAPEGATKHRFYGVSVFKRGWGGQVVEYLHARDLVINKPKYYANWVVEEVRRRTRGL